MSQKKVPQEDIQNEDDIYLYFENFKIKKENAEMTSDNDERWYVIFDDKDLEPLK